MAMDELDVLRNPLLGPLMGRAPAHAGSPVMPLVIDGKRVRWRISQQLANADGPLTAAQLKAATGFGNKEISAALAKLSNAGDVCVVKAFLGWRNGYQWTRTSKG